MKLSKILLGLGKAVAMKRRHFLYCASASFISLLLGGKTAFCIDASEKDVLNTMMIIDAHAHPDEFYSDGQSSNRDVSSSINSMEKLRMSASVFSAIGDRPRNSWGESFQGVMGQLSRAMDFVESGRARLILKASDIRNNRQSHGSVGCILGIEGANPLEDSLDRFNEVYRYGVRLITLAHYRANDFTDVMTSQPKHGGLSSLGKEAVKRMDQLGIVIDVAHASSAAVRDIAAVTSRPLLDSHTSVCHNDTLPCSRYRTWQEMELIAKTGGVVCTWPIRRIRAGYRRETFQHWAHEILEMKKRIGIEHVGLGTDGGGKLPAMISGYENVLDLEKLARAMIAAGLTQNDIAAYVGGNFYRVFNTYTG